MSSIQYFLIRQLKSNFNRNSYITLKFRTSLNTKRIIYSFYNSLWNKSWYQIDILHRTKFRKMHLKKTHWRRMSRKLSLIKFLKYKKKSAKWNSSLLQGGDYQKQNNWNTSLIKFSNSNSFLTNLESRADLILYRAHWANSLSQAQHFLKFYLNQSNKEQNCNTTYLTSKSKYLQSGDEITIHPKLLPIIFKNKLIHLNAGGPTPRNLSVNTFKIQCI